MQTATIDATIDAPTSKTQLQSKQCLLRQRSGGFVPYRNR